MSDVRPLDDLRSATRKVAAQSRAAKARTGGSGGSGAGRKEGRKEKESAEDKPISLGLSGERNCAKKLRAHFQTKESPLDCSPFLFTWPCGLVLRKSLRTNRGNRPCQRLLLLSQMFPEPVRRTQVTAGRTRKSQVRCDDVGVEGSEEEV